MMTPSFLLNTALPMPLDSPLCQKPPSPMTEIDRFLADPLRAAEEAGQAVQAAEQRRLAERYAAGPPCGRASADDR